jgi:hypothetical protein
MGTFLGELGCMLAGGFVGATAMWYRQRKRSGRRSNVVEISKLIETFFGSGAIENLTITERKFPFRMRADLQRAITRLFDASANVSHFCGVRVQYTHEGIGLHHCIVETEHSPAVSIPPQYEEVDIGEEQPVRCLKNGLWFVEQDGCKFTCCLAQRLITAKTRGWYFRLRPRILRPGRA